MPIHDWTRVLPDIFSDFHHTWITTLRRSLNSGCLPSDYYALAELVTDLLPRRRSRIAVHHTRTGLLVAIVDIVSQGNKASRRAMDGFVAKIVDSLEAGIHALVIDLHPPGRYDPQGIHGAIWSEFEEHTFVLPADKPLTLAAYSAGPIKCAYIEPVAVGGELPDMPLFLTPDTHVMAPLALSYQSAWEGVPPNWQRRLET